MKKFIFALIIGLFGVTFVTPAMATNGNSHWNEDDGCNHGNSHKSCRPDPQPEHGKDCEEHGNHGGNNEDHCDDSDTPVSSSTTTTTTTKPPKNPETPEPPVGPPGPQGPQGSVGPQGPPGPVTQVVVIEKTVTVTAQPPVALPRTA